MTAPQHLLTTLHHWNDQLAAAPLAPLPLPQDPAALLALADAAEAHSLYLIAEQLLAALVRLNPKDPALRKRADRVRNFRSQMFVQVGQLQDESSMSALIRQLVADTKPRVIYDVGAAAGLGTTRVFAEAVTAAAIPCTVYAIESQDETFELLRRNVAPWPCVVPVHTSLIGPDVLPPWPKVAADLQRLAPETWALYHAEIPAWYNHGVDLIARLTTTGKAPAVGLPPSGPIDIAMIDADLFFATEELNAIIDRCTIVFLDDVHGYKNAHNHTALSNNPHWQLLQHDPTDRHGWSAFKRNPQSEPRP